VVGAKSDEKNSLEVRLRRQELTDLIDGDLARQLDGE